ncbi:MAG: helix-turn-helix domain-containing protein [Acidobacteria bacterium]|nr:helix-turn-helix domain-containing protein [Acidobacteriota bacterium]
MASFGENLRRERELRGIGLRDIADATKISIRFLQALEQDRVDVLPGGIFRRAFVRQYARYVGLDAERIVAEFLYAHGEEPAPKPPEADPKPPGRRGGLVVVGLLLAGTVILALLGRRDAPVPEAGAATPVAPVAHADDRVYPPPSSQPEPEEPEGLVLTLSARQSCWVAAQVDGATVLNRVMNEGETETLEAAGEIVLSVGNAGGLTFSVNDKPGVPLGRSGEVRRNIVITPQSLPSLVQDSPSPQASHSS